MSISKFKISSLNRQIISLSVPNIVTNITVPLVGMVDIALMGHLSGYMHIGAIALGGMMFSLLYSGLIFLRMGTSGFTAQAYGAKKKKETAHILYRSFILSQLLAILLIALQAPIEILGFSIINGDPQVESMAAAYFRIRIWAAPATLGVYALSGWFLGMQNARFPMYIAIIINIVNIATSVYFVKIEGMCFEGVALGTVIAQYSGLLIAIFFYFVKFHKKLPQISLLGIIDWKALKLFFKVNNDILIRSVLLTGTFFYFNAVSASLGNKILAVNAVLLQFLMIFSYFADGFAFAAEAIVGKHVGEKNREKIEIAVKQLFKWGLAIGITISLLYWIGYKPIINLLTNNNALITSILPYRLWIIGLPIISFAAFLWDGIYTGATASAPMRNNMIISVLLVFIPARFIFVPLFNNHGLWLALELFLLARGIGLWISYRKTLISKI